MGKKHKKHKTAAEADSHPLPKLVLKVQKEESRDAERAKSDVYSSKPHKKKKKKEKKHHRHRDEEGSHKKTKKRDRSDHGLAEGEPSVKRLHIKLNESSSPQASKSASAPPPDADNIAQMQVAMRLCLENLHRTLQRRDVCGVFAFPVTDEVAPGYSKIIKHSMDFSTMMIKIDRGGYSTLEEFKDDFILMCDNAMIYNSQDTIYYKAAEKLRGYGMKLLGKEKLKHLKRSIGLTYSSDDYESDPADTMADDFGLIDVDTVEAQLAPTPKKAPVKKKRENKTAEITASILRAAKGAASRFKQRNPNGKIGFLRKEKDGSTSLAVLNPDGPTGNLSEPITIGTLSGRVKREQGVVQVKEEPKATSTAPVSYLTYGAYGSFAPTHDSSLATLSKEDSDLLLTTYGSEQGVQYARSLQSFVTDSPLFAQDLVDRFLNALTSGSHGTMLKTREQKKEKEITDSLKQSNNVEGKDTGGKKVSAVGDSTREGKELTPSVDIEALQSLAKDGIDVSFLDSMVKEKTLTRVASDIQEKLEANSALLEDLQRTQAERLADPSKRGNAQISEKETGIADALAGNLKKLLSEVSPGEVTNEESLQSALGVGLVTAADQGVAMAASLHADAVSK